METNLRETRKNSTQSRSDLPFWSIIPGALRKRITFHNYEDRKAELRIEVARLTKKTKELEKRIGPLETEVNFHKGLWDRELDNLKKYVGRIERKPLDTKNLFEYAVKSKQESGAMLDKWSMEAMSAKRAFEKAEDVLKRHKCYRDMLLKLAPPEWQEAKEAEILKAKDAQRDQNTKKTAETKCTGLEAAVKSSPDENQPLESKSSMSARCTLSISCAVLPDCSITDEKLTEIYFSDPAEVVDLPSELTDQILSLIENATEMDKMLEQTLEITKNKMEEDEIKLTMQENNLKSRTEIEEKRAIVLRKQVQLHNSLQTQDQEIMLETLGRKVTEVYSCSLESRLINLATLEKLCGVEYRLTVLLQQIENIPTEMFQTLFEIKNSERRTRLHEEKLRLEREKQKEKMHKCFKRALGESKKVPGRKLMQRCFPVQKKVEVIAEPPPPVEEDPHAELFTEGND